MATDVSISIYEAKEKHQARLMALPGVISIGIGLDEGETVVIVGLDGEHPETEKILSAKLEGYKIVSKQVGIIKAR